MNAEQGTFKLFLNDDDLRLWGLVDDRSRRCGVVSTSAIPIPTVPTYERGYNGCGSSNNSGNTTEGYSSLGNAIRATSIPIPSVPTAIAIPTTVATTIAATVGVGACFTRKKENGNKGEE
jgi:hypothetical protein